MAHDREMYGALRAATDKYVYFLLAAAGACIAFAINQTNDAALSPYQLPLGGAVVSWGLSLFFGCRNILAVMAVLEGSYRYGDESENHEALAKSIAMSEGRAARYLRWQFVLLLVGAALFVCWHVIEMYLRAVDIERFVEPSATGV
jgi:hypothetical protein